MSQIPSELLTYCYEKEQLDWPLADQDVLIWGAEYTKELASIEGVEWIQSFKPYADDLNLKNIESAPIFAPTFDASKKYRTALCCLSKQKEECLFRLASCLEALEDQGVLVAVAENNAGGKRLEKWFQELGLAPQSLSKSKCRIVWGKKENLNQNKIQEFMKQGACQEIEIKSHKFFTKAGIYGWNKIDLGSKILTDNIPKNLSGVGADFGCGYGYLSHAILAENKKIKKLYAIDADYNAVQCVRKNLERYEEVYSVECLWEDLTARPAGLTPLNWIVMNPPFHEGKSINIDVGQKFIETAARSLRKSGVLYMVANAHLPYEKTLKKLFSNVEKIVEEQGFKIFKAIK